MLVNSNPVRSAREDRLGRSSFAAAVAAIVRARHNKGLIVLGIEGAWGSGKSSVLALAAEVLARDHRNREVVVSAWRTSSQDQFLSNLSYSLATALRRDWQISALRLGWARLKRQSLPLLMAIFIPLLTLAAILSFPELRLWTQSILSTDPKKLGASLGLVGLPLLGYLISKLSQPVLEGVKSLFGNTKSDTVGGLERFAFDFDVLAAAQPSGTRFIVLVEDIDRCSPEHVTDVLSAIGQLGGHPMADRIAFLIAYDRNIVLKSIAQHAIKHLSTDETAASLAEDYLERVVQLELPLPPPDRTTPPQNVAWKLRFSPMARAFLLSLAIVGGGVSFLVGGATQYWTNWGICAISLAFAVEIAVGVWRRERAIPAAYPGWDESVRDLEPWLEPLSLREQTRILNRASAALLLRPDAQLTAWEALTTATLATRFPESFSTASLAATLGKGPLDIHQAFRSVTVTDMINAMTGAASTDHFTDAAKVHAVVSSFRR